MDRRAVIAEIESALPLARELAAKGDNLGNFAAVVGPDGLRVPRFATLCDCLSAQPEFQQSGGFFIGVSGGATFAPGTACRPLLEIALKEGPAPAVAWLEKVFATSRSDVRYVTELRGISVPPCGLKVGKVLFLPWQDQPITPTAKHLGGVYSQPAGLYTLPPPTVALMVMLGVPVTGTRAEIGDQERQAAHAQAAANVAGTLLALTAAIDSAWSIGRSWYDFVDPDLQAAQLGFMWQDPPPEAPPPYGATELTPDHAAFAARYLALSGKLRRKVDIASARLNLARRRASLGDKALEASIALEALLGDDDRFDLTYKLRLRAALLIQGDVDARQKAMRTIGDFYNLRSGVVHGSIADPKPESAETVSQALAICVEVLRRLVDHGKVPIWQKLELSGGKEL